MQSPKVPSLIEVIDGGITIVSNEEHPKNAYFSINFTDLGIEICVKDVQKIKDPPIPPNRKSFPIILLTVESISME